MQTVWKFPLDLKRSTGIVKAPVGTVFLAAGWEDHARLVVWGLVPDDDAPLKERVWEVVGTGRIRLLENLTYLATAAGSTPSGTPIVLHVFVDGQ